MNRTPRLRGRVTSRRKRNKQRNRAVKHMNKHSKRTNGYHGRWTFLGQEYMKFRCYWDTVILGLPYDEDVHCPQCAGRAECIPSYFDEFVCGAITAKENTHEIQ